MDSIITLSQSIDSMTGGIDSLGPDASLNDILGAIPRIDSSSGSPFGTMAATVAAFLGVFLVIGLIWYVLQVIAYWHIFTKAGEPGWKSIIPFYNEYTRFKLTWQTAFFWVELVLLVVGGVATSYAGQGFLPDVVDALCALGILFISVIGDYRLSRAFGHGVGFTVGLILLNPIFILILGFSRDAYVGSTGRQPAP